MQTVTLMTKAMCLLCTKSFIHWNQLGRHREAIVAQRPSKYMKVIGVFWFRRCGQTLTLRAYYRLIRAPHLDLRPSPGLTGLLRSSFAPQPHTLSRDLHPLSRPCGQAIKADALARYEHSGFTASFRGTCDTNKSNNRWCAEFGGGDMKAGFCGDRRR